MKWIWEHRLSVVVNDLGGGFRSAGKSHAYRRSAGRIGACFKDQ